VAYTIELRKYSAIKQITGTVSFVDFIMSEREISGHTRYTELWYVVSTFFNAHHPGPTENERQDVRALRLGGFWSNPRIMQVVHCLVAVLVLWASSGNALALEQIVLAVPGPGSLVYLPVQLAQAIGADRAEDVELKLRYFPGGPLAMRDLRDRNSDFAVVGLPAIASARADGMPVLAVGQLSQAAMVSLMLRHDLKDQIKTIAQLKGLRIGTNNSTRTARSTSQMLTEYLLARAGIKTSEVQIIPTGQNRESQRAALESKSVDALMGDEPFASELVRSGKVVLLADLFDPHVSASLLGGPFVHAALATREDVYADHAPSLSKVQRIFERTLQWISQHSAAEIMQALSGQVGYESAAVKSSLAVLERNPGMYPQHLVWDAKAVEVTQAFYLHLATEAQEKQLRFSSFVREIAP
jgi:NitT/TauT family transport system substrate-binding protein